MTRLATKDALALSTRTLAYYDRVAESFCEGTIAHDVTQNHSALLESIEGTPPFRILDLGCGPGRDLAHFRALGHEAIGVDGAARFVEMARRLSGAEVWHQNFVSLSLPAARFDGVFANASLFHVPTSELARVLRELADALVGRGVLFASNPWGPDSEGTRGERYGAFHSYETWRAFVTTAGFEEIRHFYRPTGKPRHEQPWLATVWRKLAA